ncbi:hypothetical protein [Lactobacillus psittaci]|uniref:Lipoprotein n=1 Tax=Lactobacillus psittaci DSM 15354 TaxID=1122152 RepID=A0A0R1S294_9LACO|nr:hypothetical protein [Lactobacillus psittaci]KRL63277.1 hypothetical protein FC23_GL000846 [Lactobacillus psittaci DSM 15354]
MKLTKKTLLSAAAILLVASGLTACSNNKSASSNSVATSSKTVKKHKVHKHKTSDDTESSTSSSETSSSSSSSVASSATNSGSNNTSATGKVSDSTFKAIANHWLKVANKPASYSSHVRVSYSGETSRGKEFLVTTTDSDGIEAHYYLNSNGLYYYDVLNDKLVEVN